MIRQSLVALMLLTSASLLAGCMDTDQFRTPDPETGPQENVGLEPGVSAEETNTTPEPEEDEADIPGQPPESP